MKQHQMNLTFKLIDFRCNNEYIQSGQSESGSYSTKFSFANCLPMKPENVLFSLLPTLSLAVVVSFAFPLPLLF